MRSSSPAETDSGTQVFLVAKDDAGVSVTPLLTTGLSSAGELDLSGVELGADRIVGDAEVLAWLSTHKTLGYTALQLGVLERALELTAEYARTREQFDRPIGSFQAVSARLADDYIDIKGGWDSHSCRRLGGCRKTCPPTRSGHGRVLGG